MPATFLRACAIIFCVLLAAWHHAGSATDWQGAGQGTGPAGAAIHMAGQTIDARGCSPGQRA